MPRAFHVFICLFLSGPVIAGTLTTQTYSELKALAEKGDRAALGAIAGYQRGILETISGVALQNDLRVELGGVSDICLPSINALTIGSVERAIELAIQNQDRMLDLWPQSSITDYSLAHLALTSMPKIFPCPN